MSSSRTKISNHNQAKVHRAKHRSSKQPSNETNHVLFLKRCHTIFEAPDQKVSVFFDECNREIISLSSESDSKTKVVIQATDKVDEAEFLLPIEKRILSIKFNNSRNVLAYHVEKSNIEFINVIQSKDPAGQVSYSLDVKRYVHSSRAKNSKLFGFLWTGPLELVMITDVSIEYYHVDPVRRRLRHEKSFQSLTNWFVYQPCGEKGLNDSDRSLGYSILMTSTGSLGNSMQPYMFIRNQMIKLQRFSVEGNWQGRERMEMFERSITIASIYNSVRLLVLQHESLNVKSRGAQILIYTVDIESGTTSRTHTLDLDVSGRFAINILDNLVIAHDQPSKSSFIFDIQIESTEKSDFSKHFVPLISGQPIKPLHFDEEDVNIEMYSLNWVFFQPNFVIDAKIGMLATLQLDLSAIQDYIQDNFLLLNFLAKRNGAEGTILRKCKEIIARAYELVMNPSIPFLGSPLADVSSTFEILCKLVSGSQEIDRRSNSGRNSRATSDDLIKESSLDQDAYINQEDVYRIVLQQFDLTTEIENSHVATHVQFVTSALLEFVFIMRKQGKNIEFCIYEQLIKMLIRYRRYYQLIQMIRSEIFKDSKQLACLLLSLRTEFRPAGQLGLDMLHRLECLTDLVESLNLSPSPSPISSVTDCLATPTS